MYYLGEARWLVQWNPDQIFRFKLKSGSLCFILGQDTLLSQYLSPPRCINGYHRIVGKPNRMTDKHSIQAQGEGGGRRKGRGSYTCSGFMLQKPEIER